MATAMSELDIKLKTLIFRKEYLFSKLQKVYEYSKNLTKTKVPEYLERFSELDNVKTRFEETILEIMQIEIQSDPDFKSSTKELDSFDTIYSACRSVALKYKPTASEGSALCKQLRPSLPQLHLVQFDGQFENWTTFYDTFVSLVHDREFENIDKFHYLLSCVRGPALNIVKKFTITSKNYPLAWKCLVNKYQDNRVLVGRYLDKMLNFKPLSKSSAVNLSEFIDTFDNSFKAIETLSIEDLGDYLICHLALRALDVSTRKLFEENRDPETLPSFKELIAFVSKQVKVLEHTFAESSSVPVPTSVLQSRKHQQNSHTKSHTRTSLSKDILAATTVVSNKNKIIKRGNVDQYSKFNCYHCSKNHMIYRCDQFRKLPPESRIDRVKTLQLCFNCLKPGHDQASCKSELSCGVCTLQHHYLLHTDKPIATAVPSAYDCASESQSQQALVSSRSVNEVAADTVLHSTSGRPHYGVVLGTTRLHLIDARGESLDCRAVIDSGAQSSFITTDCAQRLGLPRKYCPFTINGIGGEPVKNHGMISCAFKPRQANEPYQVVDMVVVSKVASEMPNVSLPSTVIDEYKHLKLADPLFSKRSRVDILLGNDVVSEIIKGTPLTIKSDIPQVIETIFGFVVSGKLSVSRTVNSQTQLFVSTHDDQTLDATLRNFWEIEELPVPPPINPLDELAEEIYVKGHSREPDGRYVVPLPFRPDHPPLGNSLEIAERRLRYSERKLVKNPILQTAYTNFMHEYMTLGHMEPYVGDNPSKYVIPHHSIIRPSSSSTPLRVVFDASAKTTNNVSLNEILLTGPNLYRDICAIILNFRLFEYCLVSDICKMYRAIGLRESDRGYQHILYRESTDEPIKLYELKTVTYGLSCSPFLAIRTLLQLAADEGKRFSKASEVLHQGVYMDDILYSVPTLSAACTLQDELIALLRCGGFELKKWASNSPELLQRVPVEHREVPVNFIKDDNECTVKVLGLRWVPLSDNFYFNVNVAEHANTKRGILRLLASIYDPVGFISPCLFIAKEIMQDLWKLGISWDDQLPPLMIKRWVDFVTELPFLSDLRIERHMLLPGQTECELVVFCDASTRGYAACVYIVSRDETGRGKARLVMAKSKVAPIKTLTIPRLELMSAWLLSKLIKYICNNLTRIKIIRIAALTDSTIVLSWLQIEPYKLKTFVCNRVTQIIENVPPHYWRHVNSENNMADICSRGASPAQLVAVSSDWLTGPAWLCEPVNKWPASTFVSSDTSQIIELKSDSKIESVVLNTTATLFNESKLEFCERIFERFSSYTKLQRCFARILRWVDKTKVKNSVITTTELNRAQDVLVKMVQSAHFPVEIDKLSKGKSYIPSLRKLSPFLDEGFLRVGGRLCYSQLPFNAKHPILLPKSSRFTTLLINYFHVKYMHAGPRTLQNILNQNFWILAARRVIRSTLAKCITCYKNKPSLLQPKMAPLPASRLLPNKIFEHVGVDLGGPFFVKESLRRNAKVSRAYVALFVCFSTKAVHLETLSSLSAECFLAALDRFVSRRGLCSFIYSDCGTNFVASNKHLNDVQRFLANRETKDQIIEGCGDRQIIWKFNPPTAANQGGLWEAGIKSVKYHLTRAVGEKSLTFEELSTVFCKIEAILNSRPLCPLPASDNPDECNVLTPGHFLIGKSLTSVPEYNVEDVPINRLSRWQYLKNCSQMFWKRWKNEYLNTLQQRAKWFTSEAVIKQGDVVLIKTDNVPSCNWPLARVEEVHPGKDGIIRCVTIRTQKNLLKRPVNKLSPLPYLN